MTPPALISTSSQKGAIMGGEKSTESKLEPPEENLVKGCPNDSTPFVFTYMARTINENHPILSILGPSSI